MIEARLHASAQGLAARLARKASAIAQAAVASRKLNPTDPARWRSARLLWPVFTKG
jgi:hypothetical protein